MTGREPAWRVLASELLASTEEEKGSGERAASYLLSPLGAQMNRVLMVGDLSAGESIGKDEAQPFFRARLTDPTGTVTVTAGGFQPRALAGLRSRVTTGRAMVVGKAHLFRGRDGATYTSVRAEALRPISEEEHRSALADAVEHSAQRLATARRLRSGRSDGVIDATRAADRWEAAARRAVTKYPQIDLGEFATSLRRAGAAVSGSEFDASRSAESRGSVQVRRSVPPAVPPAPTAAQRAEESAFLDLIDELAESSVDGYADLQEALRRSATSGVSESQAEELLNRLEESGAIEEPIVGKLRRA